MKHDSIRDLLPWIAGGESYPNTIAKSHCCQQTPLHLTPGTRGKMQRQKLVFNRKTKWNVAVSKKTGFQLPNSKFILLCMMLHVKTPGTKSNATIQSVLLTPKESYARIWACHAAMFHHHQGSTILHHPIPLIDLIGNTPILWSQTCANPYSNCGFWYGQLGVWEYSQGSTHAKRW